MYAFNNAIQGNCVVESNHVDRKSRAKFHERRTSNHLADDDPTPPRWQHPLWVHMELLFAPLPLSNVGES